MSVDTGQRAASNVMGMDTLRRDARRRRLYVASMRKWGTPWTTARRRGRDAQPVKDRTRRVTEHARNTWSSCGDSIRWSAMSRSLPVLSANVGKRPMVQHSMMNDDGLREYGLIMITEPACFRNEDGQVVAAPSHHPKWRQYLPSQTDDRARHPIRSLVYVHVDIPAQQIPVMSPDVVAIQMSVGRRTIIAVSAYVPPSDQEALRDALGHIRRLTRPRETGREIIITGDFNRHDSLWGGDHVGASPRQGEADDIIDLMTDLGLQSLLPRGSITYEGARGESTIDLVLSSEELADDRLACHLYEVDHGSDHRAISTNFAIQIHEVV